MHAHGHHHDHRATDPVCGMKVAPGGSPSAVFEGTTYWFCDPACASTFREDPTRWADGAPLTHDHDETDATHHG